MTMLRYFNMFILTGIGLVCISLVGFLTQNRFLTEPGQPTNPQASLIYLGAGILMLINGWVSIRMMSAAPPVKAKESEAPAERLIDTL